MTGPGSDQRPSESKPYAVSTSSHPFLLECLQGTNSSLFHEGEACRVVGGSLGSFLVDSNLRTAHEMTLPKRVSGRPPQRLTQLSRLYSQGRAQLQGRCSCPEGSQWWIMASRASWLGRSQNPLLQAAQHGTVKPLDHSRNRGTGLRQ